MAKVRNSVTLDFSSTLTLNEVVGRFEGQLKQKGTA